MAANLGRRVAVVAHNTVNRAYLTHLLDIPLCSYRSIPQENCGVILIRYAGDAGEAHHPERRVAPANAATLK